MLMTKKFISLRLSDESIALAKRLAKERGIPLTRLIDELIRSAKGDRLGEVLEAVKRIEAKL